MEVYNAEEVAEEVYYVVEHYTKKLYIVVPRDGDIPS